MCLNADLKTKNMKTTLLLLITTIALAQPKECEHYLSFSMAIDICNATVGSAPTNNKPKLDLLYQFSMVGDNIEVNIGYENFNAIQFDKYTIGVGYLFPIYAHAFGKKIKTVLIPSIEPTLIDRWGANWETTSSHLSIGGNIALRWHLSETIAIEWLMNALPRTDLSTRYPTLNPTAPIKISNYLKIVYKIN